MLPLTQAERSNLPQFPSDLHGDLHRLPSRLDGHSGTTHAIAGGQGHRETGAAFADSDDGTQAAIGKTGQLLGLGARVVDRFNTCLLELRFGIAQLKLDALNVVRARSDGLIQQRTQIDEIANPHGHVVIDVEAHQTRDVGCVLWLIGDGIQAQILRLDVFTQHTACGQHADEIADDCVVLRQRDTGRYCRCLHTQHHDRLIGHRIGLPDTIDGDRAV